MKKKTKKYYRVKILRIPPHCSINGSCYFKEDVRAYSAKDAENKINREYKKCHCNYIPSEIVEVSKDEFRGNKVTTQ